jgi:PRTRC genetic system ThiF family protein
MSSPPSTRRAVFYPVSRWGISENTRWSIYLIGCGGTGSFIAHVLAQLAASPRGEALQRVILVDPDLVEQRNIGRQNFAPADVGYPKAQVLALRYNLAFGTEFEWIHNAFEGSLIPKNATALGRILLAGAVDTGEARRTLAHALKDRHDDVVWLDAVNGYDRGQVVIGNSFSRKELAASVDENLNIARCLPYPSLALPELLKAETRAGPSCAQAVENEVQGLFVNRFMASIVGQYLYWLLQGQLSVSQTWVHLDKLEMVSVPVNQFNIDRYTIASAARPRTIEDLLEPAPEAALLPAPDVLLERTPSV